MSAHGNKHFVNNMLKAGASGYILKDSLATDLLGAIDVVIAGEKYLSPRIAAILMDQCISLGHHEDKSGKAKNADNAIHCRVFSTLPDEASIGISDTLKIQLL